MARKDDTRVDPSPKKAKRRKKRGLGRLLVRGLLLLLVLVVGLVVAAPWIASAVAPGAIEDAVNPRLKGSINVTGVSVRWLRAGSPVQTASVEVFDDHQTKIATLTLESQVGIFDVLGGLGDLGEFVVTGHADVVRFADGTTNVERVLAPLLQGAGSSQPGPGRGGEAARLPENLRAVLRIASLTGTYTDQSLPEPLRVSLDKFSARAVVATGQPIELTLDAEVGTAMGAAVTETGGRSGPGPQGPRGTLSIQGTVDKVTQSDGTLTIDQAVADVTIAARDLPLGVADSLAGLNGVLTRAIGDRVRLDITVNGSAQSGTARLAAGTDGGASVGGTLQFADSVVTTAQPLTLTLDTARAAAADPAIQQALTGGDAAKITTIPTLSVTLADLRVPLPSTAAPTQAAPRGGAPVRPGEGARPSGAAGGTALDLRGASMTLTAALGEMGGTVVVPGQQQARAFRMAPMSVVLATRDLAEGVRLSAATDASIDTQPAGTLRVDLAATDLLDEAGGIRGGLPAVAGAVVLDDFTMAIVQPLLDAMAPGLGLRLGDAIGPTLDFHVTAQSESSGGAPLAPGAIPPTTLGLAVDSANVTAGGSVHIASDAVRTLDDQGVWLRIGSIVPIASPLLRDAGATLTTGGEVTVRVQDVMLAEPMAQTPPLDRARARVTLGISETRGNLTMGAAPTPYRIDPGTLSLTVDGAKDSIALGGTLNALVQGGGRITTNFDTTLSGLLGQLTGKAQAATSTGQGIQITARDVGRWLGAVLPPGTPVNLDTGGQISVALSGLAVAAPPATPAGNAAKAPIAPDIAQRLTMNLDVSGSGLRFAPVLQAALPGEAAPAPEMIEMGSLALSARLAPGAAPGMTLESSFTTAGQQFTAGGNLALAAPLSQVTTMREMVPRGRLALTDIPVELLQLVPLDLTGSDGQRVNVTALASEAVGRKMELVLSLMPPGRGQAADNTIVAARLRGRGLRLEGGGTINAEGFAANDTTLTATVTPRLVQMALNNFAGALEDKPRLTENATVTATVGGFTLPLDENLAPRPGVVVPLRATVETALTLDNLVLAKDGNQQAINAGPVALQGVRAVATMPLSLGGAPAGATGASASAPGAGAGAAGSPMTVEFTLTGRRPGRDAPLLGLTGNASLAGASINATAALADVDLAWLDAALAQPGMISGALGPTARADVTFNGDPASTAAATLNLTAANLTMPEPARVALSPTGISLGAPLRATFRATPEWATRYIFGQADPATQALRVNKAIPFTLSVASLNITRGQGRGPLVPGEWGIDASITAPELGVVLKTGQELRYVNPQVVVRTARQDPRKINASLTMTEARQSAAATTPAGTPGAPGTTGSSAAAPSPGTPASTGATGSPGAPPTQPAPPVENVLRASITNLMDDAGQIDLAGATAEATGRIPGFPTELIDAMAHQKGLLVELLGPAITLDLKARNVPLAFAAAPATPGGGTEETPRRGGAAGAGAPASAPVPESVRNLRGRVEADLRSERATARLAGDINNMILTTTEPLSIDLSEITRAFSEHVASGMPLVSTFEKPRTLRPATVRGEGISLPMDGNLANLNGRFSVDPGEMQFTSSNILASLLKAAGGQSSGVAGRRLQPFSFTINSGVITYEKFTLPLGEFEISTRGSVDLTNNTMDLLVYLPVGAVTDDALGMFNVGLGTTLAQIAPGFDGSLPFRLRGPIGTAKPQPALDVFVKEFGSQLVNPGNLLQRFLPGGSGDSGGSGGGRGGLPFFRRPGGGG